MGKKQMGKQRQCEKRGREHLSDKRRKGIEIEKKREK